VTEYRGRFAPTPSGPLHFGSLFAAVVSYLDAKANNGAWLVRIDDLDPPREQPGAAKRILTTLENHGLHWDEHITYQSKNNMLYQEKLDDLQRRGRVFWCQCSRKKLIGHQVYPGTCRHNKSLLDKSAVRLRVTTGEDSFVDLFQGEQSAHLREDFGDVVLKRRDQLYAYQLAVVCDDIEQNISHVIRGIDLMHSTYWQRELYRTFDQPLPQYGHFPVLHAENSTQKLSKQNLAPAVNEQQVIRNFKMVFKLLQIPIDIDTPENMLQQAVSRWQPNVLYLKQRLHISEIGLD
jgi:glutamyl-Q tRNA(Asp) synthetase